MDPSWESVESSLKKNESFCEEEANPKNPDVSLDSLGIQSPCQRMIGVSNHLLSKVFSFHYHSQKVIGSLGTRIDGLNPQSSGHRIGL